MLLICDHHEFLVDALSLALTAKGARRSAKAVVADAIAQGAHGFIGMGEPIGRHE